MVCTTVLYHYCSWFVGMVQWVGMSLTRLEEHTVADAKRFPARQDQHLSFAVNSKFTTNAMDEILEK